MEVPTCRIMMQDVHALTVCFGHACVSSEMDLTHNLDWPRSLERAIVPFLYEG